MGYNLHIHHRRSIRLTNYDYSQPGLYSITINIHQRKCFLGTIEQEQMMLNDFGVIADQHWKKLSERYINVVLDAFQVMPNHIHGILLLTDVGVGLAPTQHTASVSVGPAPTQDATCKRAGASPAPTLGNIIGAYKSLVAN